MTANGGAVATRHVQKTSAAAVTNDRFLSEDDPALQWGPVERRTEMPAQQEQPQRPSPMAILKPVLGGQGLYSFLYTAVFPAPAHEPLSELQRRSESIQYSDLLDRAAQAPKGSQERMLLVAAFAAVCLSSSMTRTQYKSLSPLVLETFEFVSHERGVKMVMEDVFHDTAKHQYITALKAWGRHWGLEAEAEPQLRFNISTLSLTLNANHRGEITFDDGDIFAYKLPVTKIGSLGAEKQTVVYASSLVVTNPASGLDAELDMREPGMLTGKKGCKHQVKGWLSRGNKKVDGVEIGGAWDSLVHATYANGTRKVLWEAVKPSVAPNRYELGEYAMQLNHLPSKLAAILPPTDSRRRPDARAIEAGRFDLADAEQARIIKKIQRIAPSAASARWFEPRSTHAVQGKVGQRLRYRYKGGYWEARAAAARGEAGAWQGCADLFGPN